MVKTGRQETLAALSRAINHDDDGCFIWPFSVGSDGYPTMRIHGRMTRLNRYVCECQNGPAPSFDHQAAHSCGNRRCLSRSHLRWATPKENADDRLKHGTQTFGEDHHNSRISNANADRIRADNRRHADIAADFGVDRSTVSAIKRGALRREN